MEKDLPLRVADIKGDYLPRGTARVYMSQGGNLFHLNTVSLSQTEVGSLLNFSSVGASDVVYCKRHVSDDGAMNVFLKNLTKQPVAVRIEEAIDQDSDVTASNIKFVHLDAERMSGLVELLPLGHFRATYHVRAGGQAAAK